MPRIAIIIVVYNGENYLPDCLESLAKQTYPQDQIKIIAVDNASRDSSLALLRDWPGIRVISNRINRGFAGANNQAISQVLKENFDYIFLLNQDTVCQNDVLEKLVNVLDNNKEVGIAQPLLLLHDSSIIQTSGNKLHFLGFGYSGDYRKTVSNKYAMSEVGYASGAAMLVKRQVFEKIGLFDEIFFAYHEDLDFGWRARLADFKILRVPQAQVWHKYQFTRLKLKFYLMERGRFIVLLKNYRLATLILIFPCWLFMEIGMLVYALSSRQFFAKIKSYLYVLAHLMPILLKRIKIQKTRLVKDRLIARYMTGRIEFEELRNPILTCIVNPLFGLGWWLIRKFIFW